MRGSFSAKVFGAITVAGIALLAASLVFLLRLDHVVHADLYNFGLQYSDEWAIPYQTYKSLTLAFLGVSIGTDLFSLLYLFATRSTAPPVGSLKGVRSRGGVELKLGVIFLVAGALALAAAILYGSTPTAFAGLGLLFWGAIFRYIQAGKYVKESLLSMTSLSSIRILDQMLPALNVHGPATYLPPKYFKNLEANRIFIAKDKATPLPDPQEILAHDDSLILSNHGLTFEPPGGELAHLLENTLGSFTKTTLSDFERTVPKALIEDLEIAQTVDIRIDDSNIGITLANSPYAFLCAETHNLPNINGSIGCPICSALACALAKSTGNPIQIDREETPGDSTIVVEYRVLHEN